MFTVMKSYASLFAGICALASAALLNSCASNEATTPTTPAPVFNPPPAATSPASSLPSVLAGSFVYGSGYGDLNGQSVSFTLNVASSGSGQFSGTTVEPYTGFGTPVNGKLHADIVGTVTATSISFTKTYRHFTQDSVRYQGERDSSSGRISGTWSFPGTNQGGTFSLTPRS